MTKTEMKTAAGNHHGAAKAADERTIRVLKNAFPWIIMVMVLFGWAVVPEYFSRAAGMAFLFGAFAVLGVAVAGINIALKKRMTADGYAAWQIEALKIAGGMLPFTVFALVGLWVIPATTKESSASFASATIFCLVAFGVYLAAGMKIRGALKERMTADAYAADTKEIFRRDIVVCFFFGFIALAFGATSFPASIIFVLPTSAAVVAAAVIFRALLKKNMTAATYPTLPPVFSIVLGLAFAIVMSVFLAKAGI